MRFKTYAAAVLDKYITQLHSSVLLLKSLFFLVEDVQLCKIIDLKFFLLRGLVNDLQRYRNEHKKVLPCE